MNGYQRDKHDILCERVSMGDSLIKWEGRYRASRKPKPSRYWRYCLERERDWFRRSHRREESWYAMRLRRKLQSPQEILA